MVLWPDISMIFQVMVTVVQPTDGIVILVIPILQDLTLEEIEDLVQIAKQPTRTLKRSKPVKQQCRQYSLLLHIELQRRQLETVFLWDIIVELIKVLRLEIANTIDQRQKIIFLKNLFTRLKMTQTEQSTDMLNNQLKEQQLDKHKMM